MNRPRRLPADPAVRALAQAAAASASARGRLSRRSFLLGAAGVAGTSALLAACGTGGNPSPSGSGAVDVSDKEKIVNWANWTLYLDYDEDTHVRLPALRHGTYRFRVFFCGDQACSDRFELAAPFTVG